MTTLALQSLHALLLLIFGFVAVAVARRLPAEPSVNSRGWTVTSIVFLMGGLNYTVHSLLSIAAYMGESESIFYDRFLFWTPIFNHSRTFAILALYTLLAVLCKENLHRFITPARTAIIAALFMLVGALLGWSEGPLSLVPHITATLVIDVSGLLLFWVILLVLLNRDDIDMVLWLSLASYAASLVFSVIYLSAIIWLVVPQAWLPPMWQISAVRVTWAAVLVGLVAYRWRTLTRSTEAATPHRRGRKLFRSFNLPAG